MCWCACLPAGTFCLRIALDWARQLWPRRWQPQWAVGSPGCSARRICCPATLPGFNIFNQKSHEFEFRQGPVFSDVLLADEINRATPRTQSALLEAMAERQVTVDTERFPLADDFFVIATQNPIEQHGTYPLPKRSSIDSQ